VSAGPPPAETPVLHRPPAPPEVWAPHHSGPPHPDRENPLRPCLGTPIPHITGYKPFQRGKESSSFLKKRTKKLLFMMAYAAGENRDSDIKVYCFFSSEKKALPNGVHHWQLRHSS
jgi:hypothetical protein